ncbi:MAG TPA: FecR domain-containing protein [Puia sp.]|jgi:transmembrane sensor|nr:FecR domain-containing protein [Puia sp.]
MGKYIIYLIFLAVACHGRGGSTIRLGDGTRYVNNTGDAQWVTLPDSSRIKLGNGTTVILEAGFTNGARVVDLDGEAMFEVRERPGGSFVVMTRNLIIVGPGTQFRVDAVRSRPGEEVDLVAGQLTIRKSYHSDLDSLPEVLNSGDMLMINREIDLMEKERMNPDELDKVRGKF